MKVKRSPTLRSEHQPFRSFGARNPARNARLEAIHPADLRPGHSGAGVKGVSIRIIYILVNHLSLSRVIWKSS